MATKHIYKDLDLDFLRHPTSGNLSKKTGDAAVHRALKNLMFTNYYERKFHPEIGSNISALLFENFGAATILDLREAIIECIENWEPRVSLDEVVVSADMDRNGFNVTIQYYIINRSDLFASDFFLERLR
tara:strand:- start:32271 stop:32660 length:390 start_codon:yes stop_codon:yes gene_type:complete